MNHKYVSAFLGLVLIAIGFFGASYLIKNKKRPQSVVQKVVKTVYVDTVQNGEVPVIINANGNLVAKRRIELFSEVQGVFLSSAKLFKEGQTYQKGEVLLRLNDEEFSASVQSQKSSLINLITGIMPDLRLDYPEAFPTWEEYLANFEMNGQTRALPDPASPQVKNFLIGRGIYAAYYNLKNVENRLSKHIIRAPFTGILTEALVNEGTLVRNGQKLGEFIDPSTYEVEVAVNKTFAPYLRVGEEVVLNNLDNTQTWKGTVSRVNGKIDQATQTITAFVEVSADELKEGMYLEAHIHARDASNSYQIERSLLIDQSRVYAVKDTVLELLPVKPVFFSEKHVIVEGLEDGAMILSKSVPGAYPGMVVKMAGNSGVNVGEANPNMAAQ
ncbi:HlyD family efflux transporter periplasmic adaptor subunit [Robertkochia marina]|uniref:HlyD family efflux transporter periplasmic adaptor subunit n=1 Tax=Robertkochia marina TaxID=1227945 RepID=A0A4S3M3U0_9FLAO|nr:HlyD family efflux transporter periplasmic adaptor subunit [Robertkochia marina]THD68807.1 HlyD family efflux transporter periplasmic adaptor subunit [Robertkochia marina]TRZ43881.1 HlyD family efflux transporter periplasmic adaptor subunit [Robertkochia marina]